MTTTRPHRLATLLLALLGLVIGVFGLALAAGGAWLAWLGGSAYFVAMGAAMLVAGWLIARGRPAGATLYGLAFVVSGIWAWSDVGFDFWPLVSRLVALAVIACAVAAFTPLLQARAGRRPQRGQYVVASLLALALVATGVRAFQPVPMVAADTVAVAHLPTQAGVQTDWPAWGNTVGGTRFAALTQIDRSNVGQLQRAWTIHTGDVAASNGFGEEDQNTPLQIGGTLFICTPNNIVLAVDGDTGARRWRFDPHTHVPQWQRCRGLGYHQGVAGPDGRCAQRLLLETDDARLIALDPRDGRPCAGFGANGVVDLRVGMGVIKPGYYTLTAAPLVAGDAVVIGGRVADNIEEGEPAGVVRAFDATTGVLRWAWDPGNPAITRLPPPGQTYTRGTPNVWAGMAYDPRLGLIYAPTGNATPDFFGGLRRPGDDAFNTSVVALDVATGRPRWRFQAVHHDLWDFDLPAQPALYDLPDGHGGRVPALIQVGKNGQIFVLNRATGTPIVPVTERPVPVGSIPGERYSPTQPVSAMPSIGTATLTESDMWGATPIDQLLCRIQFKQMRSQGAYTPPGVDTALQMPGSLGGMNWGSVSIDMVHDYLIVNDMRLGLWNRLTPRDKLKHQVTGGTEMGLSAMTGTPYVSNRNRFVSLLGIPCQKPPFGTMTAIDLRTHKIAWQVPMGSVQDTGPLGIKMHLGIPIGMPTLGGSLATQGNLVFFAGTQDYYLRALDVATGRLLWKGRLPVGSQGSPMTYVSPRTGRQYVVVTAGGARQSPDRGDYVVAYALPPRA
ncbi:membrane-bound PQQ-dependent dehydrogenase, glucose/quinate/shikimate family [Sphingomonas nostoxanthinifaciens]|uniref:membrane-bound PQQ-dependent dehydrogenase, glucose/quinate/shikimate family n=1 Tax=Sphingomonas nostoxanthinifaciens TaxID=2872652 RepID=UPI001CC1E20E|nr:membrane-bound PQQ-dependent dehydrogenase, glucose/quinate/shikimate family [Sphingomonas nostoxanthinifaciens]UAK24262.1 membrane-bound PQQ-dependent dehydrogenase, glucose/quinate/shikimate family [Sphingomonas nostoxanthinifaciens]